jgi:mannose/fructose/N-acetylgalactosamine-specific phosphotransferase system component IID
MTGWLALLLIQASWSFQGAQGLGFLTVLLARTRGAAMRRRVLAEYRQVFNTNPFMAGALAGVTLHYELQGSAEIDRLSGALQCSFGASGDAFFWRSLRPGLSVLAVLLGTIRPELASGAFLVPFALVSQSVRFAGFERGLLRGKAAAVELSSLLTRMVARADVLFAFLTGMLAFRAAAAVGPTLLVVPVAAVSWLLLRSQRLASLQLLAGLLLLLGAKLVL